MERPTRRLLTGLHHRNFWLLVALVALHVAAIATYWAVRRQNLLWPMITGMKSLPAGAAVPRFGHAMLAFAVFVGVAMIAAWVASIAT